MDNIRRIVVATVFRIIQIVLLPIGAVSYAVFVIKLVAYSRKTGTSATVLASLYTRYMQHKLGTRWDEACARLMMVMPNVPQLALRLETASTLVAHVLTGYVQMCLTDFGETAEAVVQSRLKQERFDCILSRQG